MPDSSAGIEPSKEELLAAARECEAEAVYRKRLQRVLSNSTGWRAFEARAAELRERAARHE